MNRCIQSLFTEEKRVVVHILTAEMSHGYFDRSGDTYEDIRIIGSFTLNRLNQSFSQQWQISACDSKIGENR